MRRAAFLRFSRIAIGLVGVLVVAGTVAAIERLPDLDDLWDTSYGRTLLVKIGLVSVEQPAQGADIELVWSSDGDTDLEELIRVSRFMDEEDERSDDIPGLVPAPSEVAPAHAEAAAELDDEAEDEDSSPSDRPSRDPSA